MYLKKHFLPSCSLQLFRVYISLIALIHLLSFQSLSGQDICRTIQCSGGQFRVQIVQPDNVLTDCNAPTTACGGGNKYNQLFYKVRLRYVAQTDDENQPFRLEYEHIRVTVKLNITNPTSNGFSNIDQTVTDSCFKETKTTNGWTNAVAEFLPPNEIPNITQAYSVDFDNQSITPCNDGDFIHFTKLSDSEAGGPMCPFGAKGCYYADLFTVAVNAYAGETVNMECVEGIIDQTNSQYYTYFDSPSGVACVPICTNPSPITVSMPSAPGLGSNNYNVKVDIKTPNPSGSNSINGCAIPLVIHNYNIASSCLLKYAEFMLKIDRNLSGPVTIISSYLKYQHIVGNSTYYFFIIPDNHPMGPGEEFEVGNITAAPGVPGNINWSTTITLHNPNNSRLRAVWGANTECTTLPYGISPQVCSNTGLPQCDPNLYEFKIRKAASSNCIENAVEVGFTSSTQSSMNIVSLAFELEFELDPGVVITGIETGNPFCPLGSPEASPCQNYFSSIPTTAKCYEILASNRIAFCMGYDIGYGLSHTVNFTNGGAFMKILLSGGGCIKSVNVRRLQLRRSGFPDCVPTINPNQDGIPFCPESPFYGAIATETGSPVEGVDVQLDGTGGSCVLITNHYKTQNIGNYGFCTPIVCGKYTITPGKDDNPLNGVSTYDLVLISKHILGIEALNSPYKMIAADANKSNSITTFDIVEFRKLILGIYDELPLNTSWRFVLRNFSFPNMANPFQTQFPEFEEYQTPITSNKRTDFIGIKVGDVNGTTIANSKPEHLQQVSLSWPNLENAKAGAVITIPVRYSGSSALEAIQLGLRFDPTRLRLISPAMGEVPAYGAGNFGLTKLGRGEIRSLWIPDGTEPDQYIQPGAVLFYLSFQVLEQGSKAAQEPLLQLDDKVLYNYAWQPNGVQYAVIRESESLERAPLTDQPTSLSAVIMPNPSAGAISMKVHAPKAGKARLMFFSSFGVRVLVQNLTLESGDQQIQVPEFASLPAGLYKWVLLAAGEKTDGHVVKE